MASMGRSGDRARRRSRDLTAEASTEHGFSKVDGSHDEAKTNLSATLHANNFWPSPPSQQYALHTSDIGAVQRMSCPIGRTPIEGSMDSPGFRGGFETNFISTPSRDLGVFLLPVRDSG